MWDRAGDVNVTASSGCWRKNVGFISGFEIWEAFRCWKWCREEMGLPWSGGFYKRGGQACGFVLWNQGRGEEDRRGQRHQRKRLFSLHGCVYITLNRLRIRGSCSITQLVKILHKIKTTDLTVGCCERSCTWGRDGKKESCKHSQIRIWHLQG